MVKIEVIKTSTGKTVPICRIRDISILNDSFLTTIIKPKLDKINQKGCLFFSQKKIERESLLNSRTDPVKYNLQLSYSIDKKKLKMRRPNLPKGIKIFRFKNKKFYFNLLKKKLLEYFHSWKNFLNKNSYLESINRPINKWPTKEYLCLKKGREFVALVDLWEYHDFIRCPMNWIGHIWITPKLNKQERSIIHKYIKWWLGKNVKYKRLRAGVHSFNLRSQKFFRKMGFKVEWVAFLKSI